MKPAGSTGGAARGAFVVVALMTSFYCLLAYVPFTYYQFLGFPHLRWLTFFRNQHHLIVAPLAVLAAWVVWRESASGRLRPLFRGVAAAFVAGGLVLLFRPLLPALRNDATSLWWAVVWLVPIGFLSLLDLRAWPRVTWEPRPPSQDLRILLACGASATLLSLTYPLVAASRFGTAAIGGGVADWLGVWFVNLLTYLVLFAGVFLSLGLVGAASRLTPHAAAVEFLLCQAMLGMLMYALVRHVVLPGISFSGTAGGLFAAAFALASIGYVTGRKVRARADGAAPVESGLALSLAPLSRLPADWRGATALVAAPPIAYLLAVRTAAYDWNFIVQELAAAAVMTAVFAAAFGVSGAVRREIATVLLVVTALLPPALLVGVRVSGAASAPIERYAAYDVAYALARDTLAPPASDADPSFYAFLQANTNISRAADVQPVEIELVTELEVDRQLRAPNVFVIVIDSLRQDYVSHYNDAVDFTPRIASFADDSIVFRNAFSRYGATGLSQPSIWVGGMLLHQQYTTPFGPMNALDKLLAAHGYARYLSLDTILRVIVPRPDQIVNVDQGRPEKDFGLCVSLVSLADDLRARDPDAPPVFAYTQAQNVHISTITRAGARPIDDGDYGDFYAPYASRVARLDGCFGEFIDELKRMGLYDNSIVVLTSDHGDSLGEEGRWGHAYTIFPEILRIPLIVHLPPSIAAQWQWDDQALAFSSDLTPSLYRLLGHGPVVERSFFGRSLFAADRSAVGEPSGPLLVASSYGPVYGILETDGSSLFIADGVNFVDHMYDLDAGTAGSRRSPSAEERQHYRELIRAEIEAIGSFYGYLAGAGER